MLQITFQLFAKARDLADNKSSVTIAVKNDCTLLEAIRELQKIYPQLDDDFMSRCRFAFQQTYVRNYSLPVKHGDEFVIIPPISGG